MADDRLLMLAGGHNFRDYGGVPTAEGARVRRGMLFRSGMMAHLTPADVAQVRQLGIATIVDLRTAAERWERPTRWQDDDCALLADDVVAATTTLHALLGEPSATGAETTAAMIALYRDLPFKHLPMYRALFARLVEGRVPALVNCSAGKDRTGVAAALVLRALGVAPEEVERDFLASNSAIDLPRLLADSGYDRVLYDRPQVAAAMMTVVPDYLAAAFDAIDARCGSFGRYRTEWLGVDDTDLARMRSVLLE